MKIINSLLIISTIAIAQLGSIASSRANFADDILTSVQKMQVLQQKRELNRRELELLEPCGQALVNPNPYPPAVIDYCERLLKMGANYQLTKSECFAILIDPSEFPGGAVPYCEKLTGKSYEWVQSYMRNHK